MRKLKSSDNNLTPEEVAHRAAAFDKWLLKNGQRLGYYLLPPQHQAPVHEMLKRAFYAGTNYEARMSGGNMPR